MIAVTGLTGHSGGFLLQQFVDNKYEGKSNKSFVKVKGIGNACCT